nr:uncharacterized protein LOC111419605 [Onthophagus taurus]
MSNFVTAKLARKLGLPRTRNSSLQIRGLNSMSSLWNKGTIKCNVQPCNASQISFDFDAVITSNICSDQSTYESIQKAYDHLKNIPFQKEFKSNLKEVDLPLGAELVPQILTGGRIRGGPNDPVAVESIFGWLLMGRLSSSSSSSPTTCLSPISSSLSLDNTIQKFREIESIPVTSLNTSEEETCEKHFRETYQRMTNGRFVVSLPFKSSKPSLGDSYQTALRRFKSLENRLLKNPSLHQDYVSFMSDYLLSGHMSLITTNPSLSSTSYYIPHHCVTRAEGASSKIRVVFDASAVTSNGESLNDNLLIGPKLQQNIVKVLLNFRYHEFAFTCDIQQMYRQILISENHRNYQKILWRFSPDDPIEEYMLNTVTYGVSSAPFLALRTIIELSRLYSHEFPVASKILQHDTYVDDIVTGASSLMEACTLQSDLISLLRKGGFELKKWASNCPDLLQDVAETDLQKPISMDYGEFNCIMVFGLQWDPKRDLFTYSFTPIHKSCTKRSILSDIARIYDPLGFLMPCTLKTKTFIEQLWQLKLSWDDTPPLFISENWKIFKNDLIQLSNLTLPRLVIPNNSESIQLHLFCDASQIGYCAVAYLRCQVQGTIESSLLCAKARVAPLKTITISRLELCGAVLLTDLLSTIQETLFPKINIDSITAWTDSKVVLSWISSSPSRWKIFVANRVSHIQGILPANCWKHVPSIDNPADCGSRGLFPSQLISSTLWWKGPSWLADSSNNWPASSENISDTHEVVIEQQSKYSYILDTYPNHFIDDLLTKFSSFIKIQRIIAYVRRFINHCKKHYKYSTINLSPFEIQSALTTILSHVQSQHFSTLITSIKNNQIPEKSYRKLAFFLDRDGIIRVGGRLKHATIPFDHKHPVLLSKNNRVSELIVEEIHKTYLHPGQRTLQALVMQQYWIIAARSVIHRVVSRCFRCFRCKSRSYVPWMADLPSFRLAQVKAFSTVAVDFAGPIFTTISRHRGSRSTKSYICVFVCTSTKAIHLELVSDLSTEAFIAALRRFQSRRGQCTLILSDQGTNFVGAYNRLRQMADTAGEKLNLRWQFHPPGAPHFNGLAEAGVKSVKYDLLRVIGEQRLTFEEVYTLLTQIEAVLNSRPLSPLTEDPNDLQALTPAHFLCLEPITFSVLDSDLTQIPINRLDRWKLLQRMMQDFWKRWHQEYLSTLQQRQKWNIPTSNPSVGDLVIIRNEQRPPLQWEIGRIELIHPGVDGVIRVVTIKTINGRLTRPVTKLCLLPT